LVVNLIEIELSVAAGGNKAMLGFWFSRNRTTVKLQRCDFY